MTRVAVSPGWCVCHDIASQILDIPKQATVSLCSSVPLFPRSGSDFVSLEIFRAAPCSDRELEKRRLLIFDMLLWNKRVDSRDPDSSSIIGICEADTEKLSLGLSSDDTGHPLNTPWNLIVYTQSQQLLFDLHPIFDCQPPTFPIAYGNFTPERYPCQY